MSSKTLKTLLFAISVAVVCGVAVSSINLLLTPWKEENKQIAFQEVILKLTGLSEEGDIGKRYQENIKELVLNMDASTLELNTLSSSIDFKKMLKSDQGSRSLTSKEDIASLEGGRLEKKTIVYARLSPKGKIQYLVLPVRGYGLWSTMKGFVSLGPDFKSIQGISFIEHGETPGLGGEIDNPKWQITWQGKKLYDDKGKYILEITKAGAASHENDIDGLSGATLTTKGVNNMMHFWFEGSTKGTYETFIKRIQKEGLDLGGSNDSN